MQEIDVPNLIQDSFSRISLKQQYCDRKKKEKKIKRHAIFLHAKYEN